MKNIISLLLVACFSFTGFAQSGNAEFTESSTFTVPPSITIVFIEVIGAGGSGGFNGTGGGGGGAYASGYYNVTPGQVLSITIGTAGGGAEAGTTTVDGYLMATGGTNGVSVPNPEVGGGGLGGVASGGTLTNNAGGNGGGGYYTYFGGGGGGAGGPLGDGGDGGNTIAWTGICLTAGGDAGIGGGAPGGNGGKGAGFTDIYCIETDPSAGGLNYGGGGGGGNGNGGGPGAGANGYCRILWCAVDITTIVADETITANAAGATYQWINCEDYLPIEGETDQSFTATENGFYAVIINDGICSDTSACVEINSIVVQNIVEAGTQLTVTNPFTDHITIQNLTGNELISLSNSTDRLIWSGRFIGREDFSYLPSGIYFLHIQVASAHQTVMLLKL